MDGPRGPGPNFGGPPRNVFDGPMDGPPQFYQGNMRPPFDDNNGPPQMHGFGANRGIRPGGPNPGPLISLVPGGPSQDDRGRRYQRNQDSDEIVDDREFRNNRVDNRDKRSSRWGLNSEDGYNKRDRSNNSGDDDRSADERTDNRKPRVDSDKLENMTVSVEDGGNTTPLHDEPFVNDTRNTSMNEEPPVETYTSGNDDTLPPGVDESNVSQFEQAENFEKETDHDKPDNDFDNQNQYEPQQNEYNEPQHQGYNEPNVGESNEPKDFDNGSNVLQEEHNEPQREDFNEPQSLSVSQECNELPQNDYNEPQDSEEIIKNMKEEFNEPSTNECNELPREEFNERKYVPEEVSNVPESGSCEIENNEVPEVLEAKPKGDTT